MNDPRVIFWSVFHECEEAGVRKCASNSVDGLLEADMLDLSEQVSLVLNGGCLHAAERCFSWVYTRVLNSIWQSDHISSVSVDLITETKKEVDVPWCCPHYIARFWPAVKLSLKFCHIRFLFTTCTNELDSGSLISLQGSLMFHPNFFILIS